MFFVVLLHLVIDRSVNKVLNNKSLGLSQQQCKNYKGFSSIYNDIGPGKAAKPQYCEAGTREYLAYLLNETTSRLQIHSGHFMPII